MLPTTMLRTVWFRVWSRVWPGLGVVLLALACGGAHYEHLVERQLDATEQLSCGAFLAWNHEPVRDAFLIINGSGRLSNAFVHPSFQDLLDTHRVAYATYDKPGIRAPFADPAAV
ncbi:MAG: hypothetical protein RL033_7804, partial [Pseudomonadota bacterium]